MSAAVSTTTGTALYGVTGWPLSQSLSPLLHNTGFAALGINALYMKWEVPPQKLPAFVESVRLLNIRGCSVTIPHKVELLPLLDEVSPLASRVGAANTIYWKGERLCGENTDVAGFMAPLANVPLAGADVLLLGAGGAAAGVLNALIAVCPALVVVANRTREKAQELIERHYHWANMHSVALAACSLDDVLSPTHYLSSLPDQFNLVINATSSSLHGQALQFPINRLTHDGMLYDMMYGPAANDFLSPARAHGRLARDGLGMLVEQAALSFALWRNTTPPRTAPVLQELRALINAESTQATPEKA